MIGEVDLFNSFLEWLYLSRVGCNGEIKWCGAHLSKCILSGFFTIYFVLTTALHPFLGRLFGKIRHPLFYVLHVDNGIKGSFHIK